MIWPMFWFSAASLFPPVLLALCCLYGGSLPWLPWIALASETLLVFLLDQVGKRTQAVDGPAGADLLSVLLALCHLGLILPVLTTALQLPLGPGLALLLSLALFIGQISHPNAHELIHHPRRGMRRLGMLVYSTMLLGHHVSAHLRVHHTHVATSRDPNSAPRGMGFYHFFLRAWIGSFRAGLRAENTARAGRSTRASPLSHPYLSYGFIAAFTLLATTLSAGLLGMLAYLGVAFHAQAQVFLADYVQHYGLHRCHDTSGKAEPLGAQHSWNAPHWYSSAMMLNAPRHSDHHLHPKRRFPGLRLTSQMPILPHALPVMAVIALLPPLWRQVMARELDSLETSAERDVEISQDRGPG